MGNNYPSTRPKVVTLDKGSYRYVSPSRSGGGRSYRSRVQTVPPRREGVRPAPTAAPIELPPGMQVSAQSIVRFLARRNLAYVWREMIIILEKAQAGQAAGFNIPAQWASAKQYICPTGGAPTGTFYTRFENTLGSHANNCIGGQYVSGSPSRLGIGFWRRQVPGQPQHAHVASFTRSTGSSTDPYPTYRPAVESKPAVYGRLRQRIRIETDVSAEVSTPLAPRGRTAASPISRPPPPGTKERKAMLAIHPRSLLGRGISGIGELPDYIDCFHKALPQSARAKRVSTADFVSGRRYKRKPSALEKAEAVYANFDKLDLAATLACLAANHAEDAAYGRLGRVTAEANRRRGTFGGIALGPAL